ncbi:unnamed protein product [Laminaria digitata]
MRGAMLGPGHEGAWSQSSCPCPLPGWGKNLLVFANSGVEREAARAKVVNATLYVVVPDAATGALAIVDEQTFLTSRLPAELNPNVHVWRRTVPPVAAVADDVIYRFDYHVDHTQGKGFASYKVTVEQMWITSQSDSARITTSPEIAAKFTVPARPGLSDRAELSAKVAAAMENARVSGFAQSSMIRQEHAFDAPAGANEIHQVFVRIGSAGCSIVETKVVRLL